MAAHDFEFMPGKKPTSAGSREIDAKDPMVIPNGIPDEFTPVTTTTEVGTWPRTLRKWAESNVCFTSPQ